MRQRRRRQVQQRPFPAAWDAILAGIPIIGRLPESDGHELRRHIQILLDEKRFEGCGGVEIDDTIRVTIAAHAAILLLHRDTDYYPQLESILVYPDAYEAPSERHIDDYVVEEGTELREGESWYRGSMVLSWKDVQRGAGSLKDGENVVFHEFAHQLDDESGTGDGTPVLADRTQWRQWVNVFEREFEALQDADDRGRRTLIDPYGAESPAEFFAVVTECFFERGKDLRKRHPELYDQLAGYYRQDPANWPGL
jgi:hypothetical protein